ncbi:STAS domain-containing protein [Nocardia sp. NBC_00881]|uniref:STAS domain-containing protein n=1 Tax=Nocardia sp. NBC_00881 TaxID=2975995 RepID=UPI00386EBDB3|nr:STAS domain-containing protein [Nocardia sp. NBC_00881]
MSADGTPRTLEVQVRSADDVVIVTVHGEIDMASAPHLQSALEEVMRETPPTVVVDMSNVGFLGSAGLSVLLAASAATGSGGLRVVPSVAARRPIEVTALDRLLTIFDTVEAALAADEPQSRN